MKLDPDSLNRTALVVGCCLAAISLGRFVVRTWIERVRRKAGDFTC